MKTELLREFVVFAKHKSFSAAAKELYITQPTLSTHIQTLEKEIGFSLANRAGSVELTEAGAVFSEGVQRCLFSLDSTLDRCRAVTEFERVVKIASGPMSPDLLTILKTCNNISYTLTDINFHEPLFTQLVNDKADMMITFDIKEFPDLVMEASDRGIVNKRCGMTVASICTSKANPLAAKGHLLRSDLKGATITINSALDYERLKQMILAMLGNDLELNFQLKPIISINNLLTFDYGDTYFILDKTGMEHLMRGRNDIAVFDEVDGKPLLTPRSIYYLETNNNTLAIDLISRLTESYK
jgi:DNA-binding transcriptional LysR family regulator